MLDFRLSDEAWAAACRELKAAAGLDPSAGHRQMIELICGMYSKTDHPRPAEYAEAWRAVSAAAGNLMEAIDRLRGVGAAELEFIGLFAGGDDIARFIREQLPQLREMAKIVAEIEARGPRVPSKADPNRDWLARELYRYWQHLGGSPGTSQDGPAARFLTVILSEVMLATDKTRRRPARSGSCCASTAAY